MVEGMLYGRAGSADDEDSIARGLPGKTRPRLD
jgi:hypothetical protein